MEKKIKLKRKNQLVSGISKMKVYINNKPLIVLTNGEEKEIICNIKKNDLLIIKHLWFRVVYNLNKLDKQNSLKISFAMSNTQFLTFGLIINILTLLYFVLKIKIVFYLSFASITCFIYFLAFKRNRIIVESF